MSAFPIIVGAGAIALLLSGKKKKSTSSAGAGPMGATGSASPGTGLTPVQAIPMASAKAARSLEEAVELTPVGMRPWTPAEVEADVDADQSESPPQPSSCKFGTLSSDKKKVCFGLKSLNKGYGSLKFRRVVKYNTARAAAAALSFAGGATSPAGQALMMKGPFYFAVWCWLNRGSGLYRCTERYTIGKRRCKPGKWSRY